MKTEAKPDDVARAEKAQRQAMQTAAGDAGAAVPDRDRPALGADLARKLKEKPGVTAKADPV